MGADSFFVFYGIKIGVDPGDEDLISAIETRSDPRCKIARRLGLDTHFGRMTVSDDFYFYIGQRIVWLGHEHDFHAAFGSNELAEIASTVRAKLKEAGLSEMPSFHFQFEAQY